jgi:hypothetical protein
VLALAAGAAGGGGGGGSRPKWPWCRNTDPGGASPVGGIVVGSSRLESHPTRRERDGLLEEGRRRAGDVASTDDSTLQAGDRVTHGPAAVATLLP